MLTAAVWLGRSFPIADRFNTLALLSKQDYASLHGLELHLSAQNVDPDVTVRLALCRVLPFEVQGFRVLAPQSSPHTPPSPWP